MSGDRVRLEAGDGWVIRGTLTAPRTAVRGGAVLVPGSKHEQDAYGTGLPEGLAERGVATLAIDIRGRGRSRGPVAFHEMAPRQRERVRLDVEAALERLGGVVGPQAGRLAVVAEQDVAPFALAAAAALGPLPCTLISGRLRAEDRATVEGLDAPVLCMASKEDHLGLRSMVDAYAASGHPASRFRLFDGLGFGTTMFSAWKFLRPGEPSIEEDVAGFVSEAISRG